MIPGAHGANARPRRRGARRGIRPVALPAAFALALVATLAAQGGGIAAAAGDATTTTSSTLPRCPATTPSVAPHGSRGHGTLLSSVSVTPGPHSVLTAVVRARAPRAVTVDVVARGDTGEIDTPTSRSARSHRIPILGMTAETTYRVQVAAHGPAGETDTVELTFSSGSLPADLPPVTTTVSDPVHMASGVTIFNATSWGPAPDATCAGSTDGWILGVDATGRVVWYYRTPLAITDVSQTSRGTLFVSVNDVVIREIDMLGNTLLELGTRVAYSVGKDPQGHRFVGAKTRRADIDSSHHELYELANGHLLTISTEVVHLDRKRAKGLCAGVQDADGKPFPDPTAVIGDVVSEITKQGKLVREWKLSDYFDPVERPGSDMCAFGALFAPPNWFYPKQPGLRDWTHANAAVLDPATNTLLISSRQLDFIIGIRYAADASGPAGELLWDLSPSGGDVDLTSGSFAYHDHAVEPEPDGTLLYYDNGNGRPGTVTGGGTEPSYSRAVQFALDPATHTAHEVWEHRDTTAEGTPQFGAFLGDADRLGNGDVLITYGGSSTRAGVFYSRIQEVVPGHAGGDDRVVFDLLLGDRRTAGFTAYRAERLPSLYFATAGNAPGP